MQKQDARNQILDSLWIHEEGTPSIPPPLDATYEFNEAIQYGNLLTKVLLHNPYAASNVIQFKRCAWKNCNHMASRNKKLKRCKQCKKVCYCSIKCQKKDWLYSHKQLCR